MTMIVMSVFSFFWLPLFLTLTTLYTYAYSLYILAYNKFILAFGLNLGLIIRLD